MSRGPDGLSEHGMIKQKPPPDSSAEGFFELKQAILNTAISFSTETHVLWKSALPQGGALIFRERGSRASGSR